MTPTFLTTPASGVPAVARRRFALPCSVFSLFSTKPSLKVWDSAGNFNPLLDNSLGARHLAGLTDEHSVGNHPHRYKRGFAGDVILDCSFEESLEVRGRRLLVWRQRDQGFAEFGQPLRAR